jgi:carbonic anhydrase
MENRSASGQQEGFCLNSYRLFASSKDSWSRPAKKKGEEEPALEKLFQDNAEWVKRMNDKDPDYFPKLAKGQSPDFLYIGCSDSRVSITDLTGVDLGEVFVHRNIANMVVSSDINLLSVLTYAVRHLNVRHILVVSL